MPKFIDYTNKKIGRVLVVNQAWAAGDKTNEGKPKGASGWNCKCDCGAQFLCWSISFKRGDRFECKECRYERRRGIDLTGRKFGRLTVICREIDNLNKTKWRCKCDCGSVGLVARNVLGKKSRSMSCGCLGRKEKSKHINTTLYPPAHGLSKSKFYMIKTSLIHKCYNINHPSYKKFGALGIEVCDLWRNGAKDMHEWALENGWTEGDIIVLKSGSKIFDPTNTQIIKNSDFRSEIGLKKGLQITYRGETHSVNKWAEIMDVCKTSLSKRLKKSNSIDEVFSSKFKKLIFNNDEELSKKVCDMYLQGHTQTQIAKSTGINSQTLRYHLIKNDIQLRQDDIKRYKRPEIKDEEIKNLHSSGLSMNAISDKLDCSFPTIKRRLSILNLLNKP
jgi:hypothetical protein